MFLLRHSLEQHPDPGAVFLGQQGQEFALEQYPEPEYLEADEGQPGAGRKGREGRCHAEDNQHYAEDDSEGSSHILQRQEDPTMN